MSDYKFKVGDRVRVIHGEGRYLPEGYETTIVTSEDGDGDVRVVDADGDILWFAASKFELITGVVTSKEREQLRELRKAAAALYLEGRWVIHPAHPEDSSPSDAEQAILWENLRDALGFKPGFNTVVSRPR